MNRNITLWQLIGFGITSLAGTLLHFLYDWTNQSVFAAPFSAVNESTWEHMKLLFFPMFLFACVQFFFFRDIRRFWKIKLCSTLLGLALIPVIFYTYNGAFSKSPDWFNILIFFIAAAAAYLTETFLFLRNRPMKISLPALSFAVLCFIALLFIIFTFIPPELPLFQPPTIQTGCRIF